MWLEHLGGNKSWTSLWWLGDAMFAHPLGLKLTTVAVAACRLLTGRNVTVARMSEEWLRCFDVESGKRQDGL